MAEWRSAPAPGDAYPDGSSSLPGVVTQFIGRNGRFFDEPRWGHEKQVSVIAGRLSPAQTRPLVTRNASPLVDDAVRYFDVPRLLEQGFTLSHAPTKNNPGHWLLCVEPCGAQEPWTENYPDGTLEKIITRCIAGVRRYS